MTRRKRIWRAIRRDDVADRSGIALIEFAIVLPVLLLLFLGGYQILDASACKRRVTITTRSVADLVSQNDRLTTTDVDTILAAATQIMTPYSVANAQVRVSEIKIDGNGAASVQWSRGASPYAANTPVPGWPAGMSAKNGFYIYSEVVYSYYPVASTILGTMTFKQSLIMLPRKSVSVDLA